jgi:hypothetical protein
MAEEILIDSPATCPTCSGQMEERPAGRGTLNQPGGLVCPGCGPAGAQPTRFFPEPNPPPAEAPPPETRPPLLPPGMPGDHLIQKPQERHPAPKKKAT